jgi:general secretion pathway protein G
MSEPSSLPPKLPPSDELFERDREKKGFGMGRWGCVGLVLLLMGGVIFVGGSFFTNSVMGKKKESFGEVAQQILESNKQVFATALDAYRFTAGRYPTTEQGLEALTEKPTRDPVPSRWHPYLPVLPQDPWKQPYKYRYPAVKSKMEYDVYSVGEDGVDGTADDVGNW